MTQKILNLWAGPGAGKSTTAALVFGILKAKGYNVELVREYAKELAWEYGCIPPHVAQEDILFEQARRQDMLAGKVDLIITDSPLRMSVVYGSNPEQVKAFMKDYAQVDVFVERVKPYNPRGRMQTEAQAIEIDELLRNETEFKITGNVLGAWNLADEVEKRMLK